VLLALREMYARTAITCVLFRWPQETIEIGRPKALDNWVGMVAIAVAAVVGDPTPTSASTL
jgi:hypothetical protein